MEEVLNIILLNIKLELNTSKKEINILNLLNLRILNKEYNKIINDKIKKLKKEFNNNELKDADILPGLKPWGSFFPGSFRLTTIF
jgi:hypothetical protein